MTKTISSITRNCDANHENKISSYYTVVPGQSNVMISAPHAYNHIRNGEVKKKDKLTLTISKMLSELTRVHVMFVNTDVPYDPNYDADNQYQQDLIKYIEENNIEYLIDIHGTRLVRDADIEIGTNDLKNLNNDFYLLENIVNIFENNEFNKVRIDKRYKGSNNTVCSVVNQKTGIKTLQFEISKKYRSVVESISNFKLLVSTLIDVIYYLERRDNMNDINYIEKYDKVLDIKPAYGYSRPLGVINYNQVGLEIEVSVNFNRNTYSFIKKMLKKVKDLVGNKGYFVKDGTVLGDYSFEIVLDPLSVEDIKEFYTSLVEIIEFSQGILEISKEKNCGIHMNFNKKDILDMNESHKKITSYVKENAKFFDENMYKQFKFIWDFNKFDKYQQTVGDKYLWVNYIKPKVVEIRNLKANIRPDELGKVITNLLQALYYDKEEITMNTTTFLKLDKIYDTAFDSLQSEEIFESFNENEFVIIGLRDTKAKIISLSEELKEQIKALM